MRGEGVWLYDADGKRYLDAYNNVASVGHCHPHVVEAIARQAAMLNTHTRYLHESVLDYAEGLLATMPAGTRPVDVHLHRQRGQRPGDAHRARHTGGTGLIVTRRLPRRDHRAGRMSPSLGLPHGEDGHVRTVPAPTPPAAATRRDLRADVRGAIADLKQHGMRPAALMVDTIFSSDGIFTDPPGFLRPAVDAIRAAGGIFIADEVQAGFGAHRRCDVGLSSATAWCPTSSRWASRWATAIRSPAWRRGPRCWPRSARECRYFNTFGGNPVSVAAGMAVLDVIEREGWWPTRSASAPICARVEAAAATPCADRRRARRRPVHRRRAGDATARRTPAGGETAASSTGCASAAC